MLLYQVAILAALLLIAGLAIRNHADYRTPVPAPPDLDPGTPPFVSILVPARDEAGNIEGCLAGLLAQDYPRFEVIVLDDGSTDGTAARVESLTRADDRLRLVRGVGLPEGWAGKAHACWEAAGHARGEMLLFVDADTRHEPELLSRAVGEARRTGADLLSTFPRQVIGSLGEALTVPFMYWALFTMIPVRAIWENPRPELVAACGQFLLARRDAYRETGGHSAIPASLHDGLHLARHMKARGKQVRLADLSQWISCRMYRGWRECWNGFTRNAYQALGILPVLVFVSALELLLFLLPFVWLGAGAAFGWPVWAWPVAGQVLVLTAIQVGLKRRFAYPWATVLLQPLGTGAQVAIQWWSWWRTVNGSAGVWKGRVLGRSAAARNVDAARR